MGLNWVWCGICAKYLAFGTYPTSAVGVLRAHINKSIFGKVLLEIEKVVKTFSILNKLFAKLVYS